MKIWTRVLSVLFAVLGVAALAMGMHFLWLEKLAAATAAFTAGGFMVFLSMLDKIELLKALGLEVKMLRNEIDQAEALLNKIHEVAAALGPSTLHLAAYGGRWGGKVPSPIVYGLAKEMRALLTGAGKSEHDIRAALAPWAYIVARDCFAEIGMSLHNESWAEEQRRSAKLQADWPSPITDIDGYAKAIELSRGPTEWRLQDYKGWTPEQFADRLSWMRDNLPAWVPQEMAGQFREQATRWIPELRYLGEHVEFREPDMWLEMLQRND